jgi:hypothetical protein
MKVEIVPTKSEDIPDVIDGPLPFRIKGLTGKLGDEVLGVGGLAFLPDGTVAAFLIIKEEARKYPVALHKAALRTLAEARQMGIRKIVARAQKGLDAAAPWLARLGFKPFVMDNEKFWVWTDERGA